MNRWNGPWRRSPSGAPTALERALAEQSVRAEALERALAEQSVRAEALERALAEQSVRAEALERALAEQSVRTEEAENLCESLLNSSSWRLMAPIRHITRIMRLLRVWLLG